MRKPIHTFGLVLLMSAAFANLNAFASSQPSASSADGGNSLLQLVELQMSGLPPSFGMAVVSYDLQNIAQAAYLNKAVILNAAADLVSQNPIPNTDTDPADMASARNRIFVLNAILPLIQDIHTQYFDTQIIPVFNSSLAKMNAQYGVQSLADLKSASNAQTYSLKLIQTGLDAIKPYFGAAADIATVNNLEAAVGMALASRGSASDMANLSQAFAQSSDFLVRASTSTRTQGTGLMIASLGEFLKQ